MVSAKTILSSPSSRGPIVTDHVWRSILLFFALATVGLLNNPPWKGFTKERHVELTAEPVRVAMSLGQENTFANPFAMRTGSTAHVAPALPVLQSLILRFAGVNSGGWLAVRSLPALALSLQLSLLPWLARRLGYSIQIRGCWRGYSGCC
jgi:hypothetical protein